jgi:hypothetical protein
MVPEPTMAYAVVEPDGAIKQVYGPLGPHTAMKILRGGFGAVPGPPDMAIMILHVLPQAGAPNEVVAKMLPETPVLGTVIVGGMDPEGNLTTLDVRDEESLRKIAER